MKVAAAPISWGVSELPAWGYRMTADRVLEEMKVVGFEATELGPPGYLPDDPQICRELLDRHGLHLVGGFLATILHEPRTLSDVVTRARTLAAAGAERLVLAAALAGNTYDSHHQLSPESWRVLSENLSAAQSIAEAYGLSVSFHPHVGTAIESDEQVSQLLARTDISLCLDTGHLVLGGIDPIHLAADAGSRINHVHLKDLNLKVATRLRADELTYADAVREGLYQPLGQGGLDIDAILSRLSDVGYEGWFVLEQDTALTAEPEPGSGPATNVRLSLDYFRGITSANNTIATSNGGSKL